MINVFVIPNHTHIINSNSDQQLAIANFCFWMSIFKDKPASPIASAVKKYNSSRLQLAKVEKIVAICH